MAEVVGAAFLGLIKHAKTVKGEDFLKSAIEEAGEETKKIFEKRILTIKWYSYQGYVNLLRVLDRRMGSGDLVYCRKLGEEAAKRDFETIYSMYKQQARPDRLINDASIIWKSYYRNAGTFEPVSADPANTILRIIGFKEMDPAHCRLMEGWMTQTMKLSGATFIKEVREIKCVSTGAEYHEFTTVWEK